MCWHISQLRRHHSPLRLAQMPALQVERHHERCHTFIVAAIQIKIGINAGFTASAVPIAPVT